MRCLPLVSVALFIGLTSPAIAAEKVPVLIDTDIGNDVDDAFALALAVSSPELDVRGITTTGKGAEDRAWIVCRFLTAIDRREVQVAWGRNPQPGEAITGQFQYRYHPSPLFNRTSKPVKDTAVDFLYSKLKADPGKLTIIALGPLTNIARLLTEKPDSKPWIKRIVVMGGSLRTGYDGKPQPEAEWNIKTDVKAAQSVFTAGVPLTVVPLDATASLKLGEPLLKRFFGAHTLLTMQVQALYQLWDKETPILFDPAAVASAIDEKFFKMEELQLVVDDRGFTTTGKEKPNARVATSIKGDDFLKWYVERTIEGKAALPKPPPNPSKLIANDTKLPNRVHSFEDYETDIERRWWMSGKAETANVGDGKRSCRGVLTEDFDDRMGDRKTMYTAVIFNPVPGPPMGKNPRLRFRYWLKGTDTLRVQLYSLTNGYHRCLTLSGLEQEKWQLGTVDMTQIRRPDGSGGPLSENERIDDIQFYADPRAEIIIDDVVLYDAPVDGEKQPFPDRLLYTGWFDTGKQGKEWPGTFNIVDKAGSIWKAAQSVPRDASQPDGPKWVRLHLRGERPCGKSTELFFRYRLQGADSIHLVLVNSRTKASHTRELKGLKQNEWASHHVGDLGPKEGDTIDEVHMLLPAGAELLLDDVQLYGKGQ